MTKRLALIRPTVHASATALPWGAFAACWLGGVFDGMDSSLMAVVLPKAVGQLIHTQAPQALTTVGAIITAWFLLGWTLGGFGLGWVGDRYGRLKAMLLSILIYSIFTGLSGLVTNWQQLAACRFLTGLGIGGELVSIATYLTEIWPAKSRALAIGGLLTSYQAGVFLAGGIHYLIPDWRLAFMVGALPAILVVIFRLTLKESDQWHQATHPISHSPKTVPVTNQQLLKQNGGALLVGAIAFTGLLVGYWASLSWIPTWVQSIVGPTGSPSIRSLSMMGQGLAAVLGCLAGGWLSRQLGPKGGVIVSGLGCWLASLWLFQPVPQWSDFMYAQIALLGFFVGMAQAALYVYIPMLFPTRIRATSTGLCLNMGRLATIVAVLGASGTVMALGGYAQACAAFAWSYLLVLVVAFKKTA
jgi:MFS family permease